MKVIIFCGHGVYTCVEDYLKLILKYIVTENYCSHIVKIGSGIEITNYITTENIKNSIIIYVQVFFGVSPKNYNNTEYLLNIEQLKVLEHRKELFNVTEYANSSYPIIDYNVTNIKNVLDVNPNKKIHYIPYLYDDNHITNAKLDIDVVIIGAASDHRKRIYMELMHKKINVVWIRNKYGEERDSYIDRAKIVLNVHYVADSNILETIRCYPALFKRKIVVSEESLYDENNDLDKLIIYEKYNQLVGTVENILKNYSEFQCKLDKFNFDSVKANNKNIITTFLKNSYLP